MFEMQEEEIEMANDTPYGLSGAVFDSAITRALRKHFTIFVSTIFVRGFHKQININLTSYVVGWYEN